ncbi:MAG: hypothetical protein PHN84_15945 [Desulfuromonadaceae bacterium]|nr:hypothetical protein [Desulfuromonadaceae bacterium]MDD2857004.1 hypothetical protein [Desulfuromonadaceae bacterium]
MKFIAVILIILSTSGFCFAQQQVSLKDLIPPTEQVRLGINKLNQKQKQLLAEKIFNLMTAAYTEGQAINQQNTAQVVTKKRTMVPQHTAGAYPGTGSGHWIQTNIDSGEFIVLEDGSLWKIDPLDKIDASLWLAISDITVVESNDGSPGYGYLLINTDDEEKAHAKYMGQK